ncbi:MAG: hypothetical protein ABIE70_03685 [bacterium]
MTHNKSSDSQQISFAQELVRKGTHLGALIIPGTYLIAGLSKGEMLAIMIPVTMLMILIDISRLRRWRFWTSFGERIGGGMIRPHERSGDFTGATYILLTVCVTVAMFDKSLAVTALAFIMVGDTFAALVGRRWGRHRIGDKSLEGSAACLASLLVVVAVVPSLPWEVGLIGALVATVVEALPWRIDDNVTVPLLSGLAMTLAVRFLVAF